MGAAGAVASWKDSTSWRSHSSTASGFTMLYRAGPRLPSQRQRSANGLRHRLSARRQRFQRRDLAHTLFTAITRSRAWVRVAGLGRSDELNP
jgi:hypothetical protein